MRLDALPPFDGPAQDPDGEPWETLSNAPDARYRPVTLSGGNAPGSDLVWTQKSCIARWIGAGRDSPVPVVACYAAPSADALRAVLAQHAPSRVLVVTDLDPWGWALAQHLLAHLAQLAPDLPVLHRGVGDALLALSDAWLPTDGRRDPLTRSLPLSASEMARLAVAASALRRRDGYGLSRAARRGVQTRGRGRDQPRLPPARLPRRAAAMPAGSLSPSRTSVSPSTGPASSPEGLGSSPLKVASRAVEIRRATPRSAHCLTGYVRAPSPRASVPPAACYAPSRRYPP